MSETVKSVFINYLVCAVLGGVLQYIAPEKAKKTLRTCVVALMLITSLSPVLHLDLNFENVSDTEEVQHQQQLDALMHTANLVEKNVYEEMKNILINSGVDEYEIYVDTRTDKDQNTVILEGIRIEVDKSFKDKISAIEGLVCEEYRNVFQIGIKNE